MTIKDQTSVEKYAHFIHSMRNMMEFIQAKLDEFPAPDDDGEVRDVDYAELGSLNHMHSLIEAAHEVAAEL